MVLECAKIADRMQACERAGDAAGAKAADERLGFLTPILKGFLTEVGKEAADLGMQVYGGHGYIKDNRAEQVYRANPNPNPNPNPNQNPNPNPNPNPNQVLTPGSHCTGDCPHGPSCECYHEITSHFQVRVRVRVRVRV